MKYTTLLFDVDDTLLDFKAAENQGLHQLFAEEGLDLTPNLKQQYQTLNHQLWHDYEQNKISRDEVLNQRFRLFFEQLGRKVDGEQMELRYRQYLNQGHQLLGNSLKIIQDLAPKASLYVVTNGVSETQYRRLTDAKLYPYFKDIFVSDAIGYQKPRIEFFNHVFDKIPHVDLKKTLIIGDSLTSDIQGGINANIDTVWLNPKQTPAKSCQPTYEITQLEQLYPILGIENTNESAKSA